jgi:hypothetical protein
MSLLERIPTLDDDEIVNLLANARRLAQSGDEKQQAAAAELLPTLEAEAETRREQRISFRPYFALSMRPAKRSKR